MQPNPALITVTGRDRPSATSSVFAAHEVAIRDVE
jgi:predicted amino acid-binding ACT domain protein